ncbi:hypothetical protein ACXYTJ_08575 [Gilvimarinus sp. F26214L]
MEGRNMRRQARYFLPFRVFSFIVLLLMGVAILYAGGISIYHWNGIGV